MELAPTLCDVLPVDLADALEDRAAVIGTTALTLATAILRHELRREIATRDGDYPRSVARAIEQRLTRGACDRDELATWLCVTCGWAVTASTLHSVLSRLTTARRITRIGRGRYELAHRPVDAWGRWPTG